MDELIRCFYPGKRSSDFEQLDETVLDFIKEAVRSDASSADDLYDMVKTLLPQDPQRDGLEKRLEIFRLEIEGNQKLEKDALDVANYVLEDDVDDSTSFHTGTTFTDMSLSFTNEESSNNMSGNTITRGHSLFKEYDESCLETLRAICAVDESDNDVLLFLMNRVVLSDVEDTARWLLDNGIDKARELKQVDDAKKREAAMRESEAERSAKDRIMRRFDERAETDMDKLTVERLKKKNSGSSSKSGTYGESKVRYLDGKIVATNGAKYIEVDKKEEWDGGSRGKVKTKGKRGPGWVAA